MMIYVKNTIAKSSPLQSQPKAAALLPSCTLNMALTSPLFTIRSDSSLSHLEIRKKIRLLNVTTGPRVMRHKAESIKNIHPKDVFLLWLKFGQAVTACHHVLFFADKISTEAHLRSRISGQIDTATKTALAHHESQAG